MATKGPNDVAHTLNVASIIVSKYLQNAFIKYVSFVSHSLPLSLYLCPVSCILQQLLHLFFAHSPPRIPQGSRKWLLDQSGYPMAVKHAVKKKFINRISKQYLMLILALFGGSSFTPKTVFFTLKHSLSRYPFVAKPIFWGSRITCMSLRVVLPIAR